MRHLSGEKARAAAEVTRRSRPGAPYAHSNARFPSSATHDVLHVCHDLGDAHGGRPPHRVRASRGAAAPSPRSPPIDGMSSASLGLRSEGACRVGDEPDRPATPEPRARDDRPRARR